MNELKDKPSYFYKNIAIATVGTSLAIALYQYFFKEKKEKKVSKEKKKVEFEMEEDQNNEEIIIYMRRNGVDISRARLKIIEKVEFN